MSQSFDRYQPTQPPYEYNTNPSSALTITPRIIRKKGEGKSADWHEGANTALLCMQIGLQQDGMLSKLLMQNKIAELTAQVIELEGKLTYEKALNAQYRKQLLQSSY